MLRGKKKLISLTLIELVIAVSISVLLLAVSVPLFLKEKGQDRTRRAADLVAAYLDNARNLAVNPESEDAVGYRVRLGSSNKILETVRLKQDTSGYKEDGDVADKLYLQGFSIDKIDRPIDFYCFSGEFRDDQINLKVISDQGQGNSNSISVTKPGVINVL